MTPIDRRKLTCALAIAGCLAVALFFLIYPVYVIQPFRYQGVRELGAALLILRFRPVVMVLLVATTILATVLTWRAKPRMWRRIVAALGALLVCVIAGLSRINIYEIMFHPIGRPAFLAAGDTKLAADEMVVAVKVADAARAYPIRSISYHHVVNDVVGGVPIVATY